MSKYARHRMNKKNARSTNYTEAIMRLPIGSLMRRLLVESWAGKTPDEIATELDCHPKMIRIHLARFNAEGVSGLGTREGAGRKPRLTERERSQILALVKQPPSGRLERRTSE